MWGFFTLSLSFASNGGLVLSHFSASFCVCRHIPQTSVLTYTMRRNWLEKCSNILSSSNTPFSPVRIPSKRGKEGEADSRHSRHFRKIKGKGGCARACVCRCVSLCCTVYLPLIPLGWSEAQLTWQQKHSPGVAFFLTTKTASLSDISFVRYPYPSRMFYA